jgi:hypothetical protein
MPTRGEQEADEELWSDEEQPAQVSVPAFTELKAAITQAIAALGGEVMPKLNWSAPKVSVASGGGVVVGLGREGFASPARWRSSHCGTVGGLREGVLCLENPSRVCSCLSAVEGWWVW